MTNLFVLGGKFCEGAQGFSKKSSWNFHSWYGQTMGLVPADAHTYTRTSDPATDISKKKKKKNDRSTKASAYSSRVFALSKLNSYYLTVLSFVRSAGSEGSISYCRFVFLPFFFSCCAKADRGSFFPGIVSYEWKKFKAQRVGPLIFAISDWQASVSRDLVHCAVLSFFFSFLFFQDIS